MAITGFNESKLSNSEVFTTYKNMPTTKEDPVVRANKLIQSAKSLTPQDIETAHVQLKQGYSNTLSKAALKAYETGQTVIKYNADPNLSMIQLIPFMTLRQGNAYKTYIFLDSVPSVYRKGKDGTLTINASALHDLLVGALISNAIKTNYSKLTGSQYLEKTMMMAFSNFYFRIINREYLLGSDKIIYDSLFYAFNRFFLEKVFESSNGVEHINALAGQHFRFLDQIKIDELKASYDAASPQTLSELLKHVKTLSPRMGTLDLKKFINNWVNYFLPPAYLAMDNIEYLIFMVQTLKQGNNLVSINAGEIVKELKGIRQFEEELLKLI
jgi:hypothetical protein